MAVAEKVKKKDKKGKASKKQNGEWAPAKHITLSKKEYEKQLSKLQAELVDLEEWVKFKGLRVVAIFEGRDTAGKGGVIKRITAMLNPRVVRVVALPAP